MATNEVRLDTLQGGTKLLVCGDYGKVVDADDLRAMIAEGVAPKDRVCVPDAIGSIFGFTSESIDDAMADAIEDRLEEPHEIIAALPEVEMNQVRIALDALWAAVRAKGGAVYYAETGATVVWGPAK